MHPKTSKHNSTARISQDLRRAIIEATGTVQEIAVRLEVSEKTVRFWKKRGDVEMKSTRPKNLKGVSLDEFEKRVLLEAARLSRYHHLKLIEYLNPVLERVGRDLSKEHGEDRNSEGGTRVSERTSRRYLNDQKLLFNKGGKIPVPGTVAIHAVRVTWSGCEKLIEHDPNPTQGQVIAILERHTGLVFLKAYQKLEPKLVVNAIDIFLKNLWCFAKKEVCFVSRAAPGGKRATALGRANPKPVDEYFSPDRGVVINTDEETFHNEEPIHIPGNYQDIRFLNRKLREVVNLYNCGKDANHPGNPLLAVLDLYRLQQVHGVTMAEVRKKTLLPVTRIRD